MGAGRILALISIITFSIDTYGQSPDRESRLYRRSQEADSSYCDPSVVGAPPTKGIIFKYERILDYQIRSDSRVAEISDEKGEVRLNRRIELKVRAPLVLKKNLNVALGFRYFMEKYRFDNINHSEYPFYKSLENKPLKSIGGTLYVVKPFIGNKYFMLRAGLDLNGDYTIDDLPTIKFLRISITPLFGIKKDEFSSYAIGFSYNHVFGRPVISPIVTINKTFNKQWGLETTLPTHVRLRYTASPKNIWHLVTELNGGNYTLRLNDSILSQRQSVYLQKSEIRFLINYEREIYDFLWFSLEAGMRTNINFKLANSFRQRRNPIIDNKLNNALLVNASFFLVPPKKMMKKYKK
jgi:hypothetical protein